MSIQIYISIHVNGMSMNLVTKTKVRIPVLILISYVTWVKFLVSLSPSLFTYKTWVII